MAARTKWLNIFRWLPALACFGLLTATTVQAASFIKVPFTPDHWRILDSPLSTGRPDAFFSGHEGFPQGVLFLKAGAAALQGLSFRDGTIEFDLKALAEDLPGIQFRMQGAPNAENGEEFYIRTSKDCRASDDCIQYAPIINGFMLWNAYPQYQTQAFILDGWNHIKLVISGRRMNVYINRFAEPALVVGNLESSSAAGGIALRGPAIFANLTVTPDAVDGLPPQPTPDPTLGDHGIVRHWQVAPLTSAHLGATPAYTELPPHSSSWTPLTAGRFGLVNLNREFVYSGKPPRLAWLRSTVISDRAQTRHVSLGWVGYAWVFVNGKLVAQGKNYYYPEFERRNPDGRISLENGSFDVPLQSGRNEVVVALYSDVHDDPSKPNRYGWGIEMRYDDPSGLRLLP